MPAVQQEYMNFVTANVPTGNATETVVCTTKPVSSAYAGCAFGIQFSGDFTVGASTTSLTWRIRQDSLTGTAIYTIAGAQGAAANVLPVFFACIDTTRGETTGVVWVLTAQQAAGTAPGGLTNGWSSVVVPV